MRGVVILRISRKGCNISGSINTLAINKALRTATIGYQAVHVR